MPRVTTKNVYVQKGRFTKQLLEINKGSKKKNEVSKNKKGFIYIVLKDGKLQFTPGGTCFRAVRFLKIPTTNLTVTKK